MNYDHIIIHPFFPNGDQDYSLYVTIMEEQKRSRGLDI